MAAAPALTAELQLFVHRVEELLGRAREGARTEDDAKSVVEVEEQFRARVVPFINSCREALFGGGPGRLDDPDLERLGVLEPVTTRLQPSQVKVEEPPHEVVVPIPVLEQPTIAVQARDNQEETSGETLEGPSTMEEKKEVNGSTDGGPTTEG